MRALCIALGTLQQYKYLAHVLSKASLPRVEHPREWRAQAEVLSERLLCLTCAPLGVLDYILHDLQALLAAGQASQARLMLQVGAHVWF